MSKPCEERTYTYAEKLLQANKEAKATVVALILTVLVWIVGGFGLAGVDVQIFGTPIWIIGGTLGVWVFAMLVTVVLSKFVFKDFDLDEEAEYGQR